MVGSCWWNSACLCILWSYNKQWSIGIIIPYVSFISFIHTSPRHTDLRQLQGRRDKKQHEPSTSTYPPKTAASGSTPKKSTCICGICGLAGLLACRALFLGSFRRLALTRLDMARQPSNRSRLSWIHGSTFTGCHSWFFSGKDMVTVWSIERQVVKLKPCLNGLALQVRDKL